VTAYSLQPAASERPGNSLRSHWPEWTALSVYAALLAVAIPFHRPWADEAQAWQLARSLSLQSLFQTYIRYEGTPGLWYLVLWILNRAHISYTGMHWFCGVIAVSASALLIFRSPFPRYLRLTLPFTFFLLFQYAVVARGYVLVPILLYLIAICWKRSPLLLALLLGLLANIALHAAMISAGLALVYAINSLRGKMPGANCSGRRQMQALAILLCFYAAALWTAWPPPDQLFKIESGPLIVALAIRIIELCWPWATAIPFWIAIALMLRARGQSVFLLPLLLFVAFSLSIHCAFWHAGLLFPLAICVLWITWPAPDRPGTRRESIGRIGLVAIAGLQICWSAYALDYDHCHAYSPDLATSEFLRPFVRQGAQIAVTSANDPEGQSYRSVGLLPYFDQKLFVNQTDPFWWWSTHNQTEELFLKSLPAHPALIVVEVRSSRLDQPISPRDPKFELLTNAGYRLTNMFCGATPEGFALMQRSCHLIFQSKESLLKNAPGHTPSER
jgi:hypothetical protein